MKDTYFQGVWRMDWGLGNTNKTAVLISTLMIGIWALAYFRKWGFWPALIFFVGLGICLVHTVSRGGLLAACSGFAVVLWYLPRPWAVPRVCAVLVGIVIIISSSVYLKTYARYGEGIAQEDPSINNRIALWRISPRMMVDAPTGWGIGNSGKAYMQWYQPINRHEKYRTLVDSHLTWLVELGWPLRFVYVMSWCSILALTFPIRETPWTAIPFGIWIAFFIGSFFSSVAESVWLWVIPIGCLLIALVNRWYLGRWLRPATWLILMGLSALSMFALLVTGFNSADSKLQASEQQVIFGKGNPKAWILVDPRVIGSDFGRTLRQNPPPYPVGLITSTRLPKYLEGDTLIICGALNKEELEELNSIAGRFSKILFVNPTFYPQELKINSPLQVSAVFGEFSQSSSINEWKLRLGKQVSILPGIADFIPKWSLILSNIK
jgi:hypothetical protein